MVVIFLAVFLFLGGYLGVKLMNVVEGDGVEFGLVAFAVGGVLWLVVEELFDSEHNKFRGGRDSVFTKLLFLFGFLLPVVLDRFA